MSNEYRNDYLNQDIGMHKIAKSSFANEDEYFLFEEKSEVKHELINGSLSEMSGVSIFHIDIVQNLLFFFRERLSSDQYRMTFESYKYRTPDGNFFYPNLMICETDSKKYYAEKPILIIEVLSFATRKIKIVDKFIQYQKAETLQYYLCIEPEKKVVFFYSKTAGEWNTIIFTNDADEISLPHLSITISLKDIYQPS